MSCKIKYIVDIEPEIDELCALRESIGWDRAEKDYPKAFEAYETFVTAHDAEDSLIGWCAALSDSVRHAFLIDVIVDPRYQRQGIGRSLVEHTVDTLKERGISIIHVDFESQYREFYERCGFVSCSAGILQFPDHRRQ